MKLVFFGVQGSGKGTQADILSHRLHIPHITTSGILLSSKGKLRKEIDSYINRGKLVPNEITIEAVKKRLENPDCVHGFILDGYPRNRIQAHALRMFAHIDYAIAIELSDTEAMQRIRERLTCSSCGAIYNTRAKIPLKEGVCDRCGKKLMVRKDDTTKSIKARIKTFHTETKPLLAEFAIIHIDGAHSIHAVSEELKKKLGA